MTTQAGNVGHWCFFAKCVLIELVTQIADACGRLAECLMGLISLDTIFKIILYSALSPPKQKTRTQHWPSEIEPCHTVVVGLFSVSNVTPAARLWHRHLRSSLEVWPGVLFLPRQFRNQCHGTPHSHTPLPPPKLSPKAKVNCGWHSAPARSNV